MMAIATIRLNWTARRQRDAGLAEALARRARSACARRMAAGSVRSHAPCRARKTTAARRGIRPMAPISSRAIDR
jgi:hypothetical protein